MLTRRQLLTVMVASTVIVVAVLWLVRLSGFEVQILEFLGSLKDGGSDALALFALAVVFAVLLLLPSVMLTLGAGYLFGLVVGSAVMLAAEMTALTIAFLIARWLLPARFAERVRAHAAIAPIDGLARLEGWRFVLLLRLIPFFPYKLSNYALGLSSVSLRDYLVGSAFGIVPITVFNVYLGSLASSLVSLREQGSPDRPLEWVLYLAGFSALGVAIYILGKRANRRFDELQQSKPASG